MSEQAPETEEPLPDLDMDSVTGDSVRSYLNEIRRTPLLSADEEVLLCRQVEIGLYASHILNLQTQVGLEPVSVSIQEIELAEKYQSDSENLKLVAAEGVAAKNRMIQANLRLVVSIAKRYQGRGLDFIDLIQEGNVGMIHAVEKFDYIRGNKFSTYGTWWIRQAITRGLADKSRTIRVPIQLSDEVNRFSRVKGKFLQDNGREATDHELALISGTDLEKTKLLKSLILTPISLDRPITSDENTTIAEIIEDSAAVRPDEITASNDNRSKIAEAISQLEPRQAFVIKRRYGLDLDEPQKLDQVGQEMGVTRERVRQIQKKAEERLRVIFQKIGITSLSDY